MREAETEGHLEICFPRRTSPLRPFIFITTMALD